MSLSTIKGIGDMAESTARNLAANVSAGVRSRTSIVGRAAALIAGGARRAESTGRAAASAKRRRDKVGVYVLTEEEARAKDLTGGELFRAPDGYIRKTPVQTLKVAPDYKKRIVSRIITWVVVAAVAVAVVYALNMYGVLTF